MARIALLLSLVTALVALLGGARVVWRAWRTWRLRRRLLLAGLMVMLLSPAFAHATSCTPGTDCYCDKVQNVSNPIYDANLLFCEDWEAPTLRLDQGSQNPPYYGPEYGDTFGGFANNRGADSYMVRKFSLGVSGTSWNSPNPVAPTLGTACAFTPCWGHPMWHPTNLWSANSYIPSLGIFTGAGNWNTWVSGQPDPTNASGGGSGVFDGNASMGFLVPAGETVGILGAVSWTRRSNFSITQALAFPTNLSTSGLVSWPWKQHEYGDVLSEMFTSHNGTSLTDAFPFSDAFIFGLGGSYPQGACETMLAAATVRKGTFYCNGAGLLWHPNATEYVRSTDFPLGTWGCVQGAYTGMNSTNLSIKIWFNNTLIIDADGINDSALDTSNRIAGFSWNTYSNANQGLGETPTTQMSGRFEDNMHITASTTPVSCAQIGFGGSSASPITSFTWTMWSLPFMEAVIPALGLGWHFRRAICAGTLATVAVTSAMVCAIPQLTQRSYVSVTQASKASAVTALTVVNRLLTPRPKDG